MKKAPAKPMGAFPFPARNDHRLVISAGHAACDDDRA